MTKEDLKEIRSVIREELERVGLKESIKVAAKHDCWLFPLMVIISSHAEIDLD